MLALVEADFPDRFWLVCHNLWNHRLGCGGAMWASTCSHSCWVDRDCYCSHGNVQLRILFAWQLLNQAGAQYCTAVLIVLPLAPQFVPASFCIRLTRVFSFPLSFAIFDDVEFSRSRLIIKMENRYFGFTFVHAQAPLPMVFFHDPNVFFKDFFLQFRNEILFF